MPDDGRSISQHVVSLNILAHGSWHVNLLYYEHWTDKRNIFTYIKTHYGEAILAKIRELEKTMIKYSRYTNHLRFSLRCDQDKVLPKDLQLKSRIKIEWNKTTHCTGKLLSQERIHINHVTRDRVSNSIEQLKRKISESITPEEFHLVEKIPENSNKIFWFNKKETYTETWWIDQQE